MMPSPLQMREPSAVVMVPSAIHHDRYDAVSDQLDHDILGAHDRQRTARSARGRTEREFVSVPGDAERPMPDTAEAIAGRPCHPGHGEPCRDPFRQEKTWTSNDYSSPRGFNGYYVVNAKGSPDSKFFVYSVLSSGGHSPWQFPMAVYDRSAVHVSEMDRIVALGAYQRQSHHRA
jgi:hypothetical protein